MPCANAIRQVRISLRNANFSLKPKPLLLSWATRGAELRGSLEGMPHAGSLYRHHTLEVCSQNHLRITGICRYSPIPHNGSALKSQRTEEVIING
jgi:hypothetical protein